MHAHAPRREKKRHGTRRRTRDSGEPASQRRPNRRQMGTTSLRRSPLEEDSGRTAAIFRRDSCWEVVGDVAREKGATAARSPATTSPRRRLATSGTAGHIQIGAGSDESPPQCLLLSACLADDPRHQPDFRASRTEDCSKPNKPRTRSSVRLPRGDSRGDRNSTREHRRSKHPDDAT